MGITEMPVFTFDPPTRRARAGAGVIQLLLTPNTTKKPGPFAATVTLRPVGAHVPAGVTLTLPVEGTLAKPENK